MAGSWRMESWLSCMHFMLNFDCTNSPCWPYIFMERIKCHFNLFYWCKVDLFQDMCNGSIHFEQNYPQICEEFTFTCRPCWPSLQQALFIQPMSILCLKRLRLSRTCWRCSMFQMRQARPLAENVKIIPWDHTFSNNFYIVNTHLIYSN